MALTICIALAKNVFYSTGMSSISAWSDKTSPDVKVQWNFLADTWGPFTLRSI